MTKEKGKKKEGKREKGQRKRNGKNSDRELSSQFFSAFSHFCIEKERRKEEKKSGILLPLF